MKVEKIWTKDFTAITVSHAMVALGMYMLTPTIPLFLVGFGATESQVGAVVTGFYLSTILTRLLINAVLTRTGKKRMLIAGSVLSAVVMALFGFVNSVAAAAALRIIMGIGLGTVSTIGTTMAVDFLPESRMGEGLGYFSMGMVVAMTFSPAIALYLRSNWGFMPMFLAAAGSNLISAVMVLFVREPNVIRAEPTERPKQKTKLIDWRNLYDRRLIAVSVIVFLFGINRSVDMNYIALFAEERSLAHLPWYFAIQTATMFCIRFVVGKFSDRKGRNWILIPGGVAVLALMITLSYADTSAKMLLGAFFSGLGFGILAPNLQLWTISTVEPEKRIVANATYFNFVDIGSAVGAPLMGIVAEFWGFTAMFRAGACTALLYIVGYIVIGREKKRRSLQSV